MKEGSSVIVQEFTVITNKKGNLGSVAQGILVQRSEARKQLLSLVYIEGKEKQSKDSSPRLQFKKGKKREETECLSSIW